MSGHITEQSLNLENETKLGISFPEEPGIMSYYNCTEEVLSEAENILRDRPNGSEVFLLIEDSAIWELMLCHEHNGIIIECGNEL